MNAETVVEVGKWTSLVNHIKNNRIEYLVLVVLAHTLGLTQRVLDQTSGVCL
tara:strand:+ start:120 stop:275 length:156 start_codon:yes stop_codon:yes gene_type:complete